MAISSEINTGSFADGDLLFQDNFDPLYADSAVDFAQGSSCGQPLGKRDAFDDLILS